MTLRIAAALSLLVGAAGLMSFLHVLGKGPFAPLEARHLREMKDRLEMPAGLVPYRFGDFARLPKRRPVAEYSAYEAKGVVLEGYVQRMLIAPDGDYHIELAEAWRAPGRPDTTYLTAEITPGWRRGSSSWRYETLVAAFRPNAGGITLWEQGPRRVRLSGWLLYDYQHEDHRGFGARRLAAWEVHPVTRIELWDDAGGTFAEHRR